jgi:rhamnogalacturonyl hydrolase YesR
VTPPGTPASVVTSAVGDAFWTAYKVLGDARYLDMCAGICRGFLTYLNRDEMQDGTICFSYTPIDDFHVHNANLFVAELLTRVGSETGRQDWIDLGIRAGQYALVEQNPDGSLYYWGRVQDHRCPRCIDHYHSGFEIRCLYGIAKTTGRQDFHDAAMRYYDFYLERLVLRGNGFIMPKMTPSSVYPVNIHSCAESILLAATLYDERSEARELMQPLARWAIDNMQSTTGSFAYMRRRSLGRDVVHDIPYLRWGQGWMLLALSQYLLREAA